MSLEDLTGPDKALAALVKENPTGLDGRSEGDDHIRGVKNALLNTFGPMQALTASLPAQDWVLAWDAPTNRYRPVLITNILASPYAPGTLVGFTMANNAVDVVNDLDIAAGRARGQGDVGNIVGAAMTKRLDAAWSLGNAGGFRAAGVALADGTYHIFAARRPDSGVVDYFADSSVTGANVPATDAAYTERRRIGSIVRAAGVIVPFIQQGGYFRRKAAALDFTLGPNPGIAAIAVTLPSVPLGINVIAEINTILLVGAVPGLVLFSDMAANDEVPTFAGTPLGSLGSGSGNFSFSGMQLVRTSTAAQIRARLSGSDGSTIVRGSVCAWFDRRGRDDA